MHTVITNAQDLNILAHYFNSESSKVRPLSPVLLTDKLIELSNNTLRY